MMSKRKSKRLEAKRAEAEADSPSDDGQHDKTAESDRKEVNENERPTDHFLPTSSQPTENTSDNSCIASVANCTAATSTSKEDIRQIPPETEPVPAFQSIEQNSYLFDRKKSRGRKDIKRMVCDCLLTKEERRRGILGCGEDCLNRMLMIECSQRCPLGDHCANKRFQKKQYARIEPFRAGRKGWGLRAIERIERGSFIMEYVGEVIEPDTFRSRVKKYDREGQVHYYFMALKSDEIIDATMKGNITRFTNHSCEPNCETQKWTVNGDLRIGFFAKETIEPGDEITLDYQFQRYGKEAQKCYCEKPSCRGFIGATEESTIDLDGSRLTTKQRRRLASIDSKLRDQEFEDVALEAEIEQLVNVGYLKNKSQTMTLARLMVRADDNADRAKLLDVINNTKEQVYLRLFLDYHGLQLIWSWMVDTEDPVLRIAILQVLSILPVPNRTVLTDSKVWETVEKWANSENVTEHIPSLSSSKAVSPKDDSLSQTSQGTSDSQSPKTINDSSQSSFQLAADEKIPEDDDPFVPNHDITECKESVTAEAVSNIPDEKKIDISEPSSIIEDKRIEELPKKVSDDESILTNVSYWAKKLLDQWKDLKEGFKIPRIIRQNRQDHEKEAEEKEKTQDDMSKHLNPAFRRGPDLIFQQQQPLLEPATNIFLRMRKSKKPQNPPPFNEQTSVDDGWSQPTVDYQANQPPKVSKETHRLQFEMELMRQKHEEELALMRRKLAELEHRNVGMADTSSFELNPLNLGEPMEYGDLNMGVEAPLLDHGLPSVPDILPPYSEIPDYGYPLETDLSPQFDISSTVALYTEDASFVNTEEYPSVITDDYRPTILIECTDSSKHELIADEKAVTMTDYGVEYTPVNKSPLHQFNKPTCLFDTAFPPPGNYFECMIDNTSYYVTPQTSRSGDTLDFSGTLVKTGLPDSHDLVEGLPAPLPKNWRRTRDSSSNRQYFYNKKTGAVRWTIPPGSGVSQKKTKVVEVRSLTERIVASADSTSTPPIVQPSSATPSEASPPGIFAITNGHVRRDSAVSDSHTRSEVDNAHRRNRPRGVYNIKKKDDLEKFKIEVSELVKKILYSYQRPDCKIGRITSDEDFKFLARKFTNEVYAKETNSGKADLAINESVKRKATDFIKKYMAKKGKVFRANHSPIGQTTANNICLADDETTDAASLASN